MLFIHKKLSTVLTALGLLILVGTAGTADLSVKELIIWMLTGFACLEVAVWYEWITDKNNRKGKR